MFSAFALGTMSAGTIRGSDRAPGGLVDREEALLDAPAGPAPPTPMRTLTTAVSHSPMLVSAMPIDVIINSLRRS